MQTDSRLNRNYDNRRNNTVSPRLNTEDSNVEKTIRPKLLSEYIGQENVKKQMQIFINSAISRKEIMDHVLLVGPPGLGKTTLAQIIASEMRTNIKQTSGPIIQKIGDAMSLLTNLEYGDVLFIDEIHRLNKKAEEVFYQAMEDYSTDIIIGEGVAAKSVRIDISKFTLVGATTRMGLLSAPFRDRFGILNRLDLYGIDSLSAIIKRSSGILHVEIDDESSYALAKRSRGTPRIANRLLRRTRDFAEFEGKKNINMDIVNRMSVALEIDDYGLDSLDRKYMNVIINMFRGGPVGLDTISAIIGESSDSIEDVIEPYLLQMEFIARTPSGRIVSDKYRKLFGNNHI